MSKGVQHAAKIKMILALEGSPSAASLRLPTHPGGPGLTCPAHPAPLQRDWTCASEPGCSQTPFPAVGPVGP